MQIDRGKHCVWRLIREKHQLNELLPLVHYLQGNYLQNSRMGGTVTLVALLAMLPCLLAYTVKDVEIHNFLNSPKIAAVQRARRLSSSSSCQYPGVVTLTLSDNDTICNGVHSAGTVLVPTDCVTFLKTFNGFLDLFVYGDSGAEKATIAANGLSSTDNNDGTSTITLPSNVSSSSCDPNDYVPYTPDMTVYTSTCQIVSFGGSTATDSHYYTGSMGTSPLVMKGSCGTVPLAISAVEDGASVTGSSTLGQANPEYYTIASLPGAGVCAGDIGAPIYCTNSNNVKVVVGLVAGGSCTSDEIFTVVDLTSASLSGFSSA